MAGQNRRSTRPAWWTLIPPDLRNTIREWEAEIAAGTFNGEGKGFAFQHYDHDTKTLKVKVPHKFVFPEQYQNPIASGFVRNYEIATLYCNDVPTSPRSVIAESPEPEPEPSPPNSSGSSSSGMFVRQDESRKRKLRSHRREYRQPSEPSSPTPDQRSHARQPPPRHTSLQPSPQPMPRSSRFRGSGRQSAAAPDSDDDRPTQKGKRRKPAVEEEYADLAYPVNQPRGKLYMDSRDLRQLDLEEVEGKEGIRVRPEELTHFPPRPEILENLEPLPVNPRQEIKEGLFDRLKEAAVDKHRDRTVNTTRGLPEIKPVRAVKSFKDRLKIREDFGNFD